MKNPIFELEFWRDRLKEAKSMNLLSHAIGQGFNFAFIDKIHKEIIEKEIPKDSTVLDVACGYGRTSTWFEDSQYTGVDFVPEFIEIAKEKFPHKRFFCEDIRQMSFEDKAFDWGILVSVKEMIRRDGGPEELTKVEQEAKRVCKKVLILEYGNSREADIRNYEILC